MQRGSFIRRSCPWIYERRGKDSNLRGLTSTLQLGHLQALLRLSGETLGKLPDHLGYARGSHSEDAVVGVGLGYPPLLLQIPSYRPEVLRVDHVRLLHHVFLDHVRSRPSVGFHNDRQKDPTRRLPRWCPALLLVHEKTRRWWWVAVTTMS